MEPRLKVSKHGNSRLPDVFIQPRNIVAKDRDRKHSQKAPVDKQKSNTQQKQINSQQPIQKKQQGSKKKSRNPFLPIHQWFKLSKEMDARINQVRQGLQMQKFSKFSFQNNPGLLNRQDHKENKIKYEDCITLNLMKKTQTCCIKRILHVPTFTVYFLRQSLIDFSSIDKNDLEQWIHKCNQESIDSSDMKSQKIIKMFWNIPQSYYSLVYQYSDAVQFDLILQNTSIFPMQFIQSMVLAHLKSDLQIFNSVLLIKRNAQSQIRYLPVYEEIDDLIPQFRTFRELMRMNGVQQNQNIKKIEQKLVARLGFLILVTVFSQAIIDQDISNILFQSKDCCLFHKQLANSNSLIKIFFENNFVLPSQKQILSDFFCKALKFKPEQRASFSELSKHKLLKVKFTRQTCQMNEIITMLQCAGSNNSKPKMSSKQLLLKKMNKFIQNMTFILQGNSDFDKKQIDLSPSNQNLTYFLREMGLANTETELKGNLSELISKLKRVYDF